MSATELTHLRCEYLVNPLGIDELAPRLSWQLATSRRGARQTHYRLRVASSPAKLAGGEADRWDSGRVASEHTTHIAYAGSPLRSRDACHWCVEVTDETGTTTVSAAAFWTMGLLEKSAWSARWIAADPAILTRDSAALVPTLLVPGTPAVFHREFDLPAAVTRATVYATARGIFELTANSRRLGADLFAPEWTDYDKRIHYRTYDVTVLLKPGRNVLAATLGDGWWTGYVGWQETRARYGSLENSLLVQIEVELADGSSLILGTDSTWFCNTGPILSSDFMMGELYDSRREPDSGVGQVVLQPPLPAREVLALAVPLVAQRAEPVQVTGELTPTSLKEVAPGVWIYDLAQNIAGFIRLRLQNLPAGTRVQIRHGERLNPDGTLYVENLRRAKSIDTYITRGAVEETYQPHFTFHGFQYVELTALAPDAPAACQLLSDKFCPDLSTVTGLVIQSATPPAGHFECSHPGVNRLWLNGLWSQKDNFLSVPTDCPQRDERLGWMGDAQVFLRTATYNMDVAAFFTKWMTDIVDAQTPEGIFPDTAPRLREGENFVGLGGLGGAAGWADGGISIPYTLWRVYGDLHLVQRHWPAMVKWLDWLEAKNPSGLRLNDLANNYGDWLCIPSDTTFGTHSPMKNLLATAYWADDAAKMARLARELGRPAEATRFDAMFARVRTAFQREWLRADGELTVDTQTAYLLALAFDLIPARDRAHAADRLVNNIAQLDWHLSTGFIGVSLLNPILTLTGHADVAYKLLLRDDYPSWLYPVKHGATTIWERWNGWTKEDGFFNPHMNSLNHYSLGSVGEWLFRHVAGIELADDSPGFQHFTLLPYVAAGLTHARATYRTLHGEILSDWKRVGDRFTWTIRVPANCTARVYIPRQPGKALNLDGLKPIGDGDSFHLSAPAGTYTLSSTLAPS